MINRDWLKPMEFWIGSLQLREWHLHGEDIKQQQYGEWIKKGMVGPIAARGESPKSTIVFIFWILVKSISFEAKKNNFTYCHSASVSDLFSSHKVNYFNPHSPLLACKQKHVPSEFYLRSGSR